MERDKDKPFDTFVMIERLNKATDALKYIECAMGKHSRDHYQHSKNVIENLKNTAKRCLDDLGVDREGYDPHTFEGNDE